MYSLKDKTDRETKRQAKRHITSDSNS